MFILIKSCRAWCLAACLIVGASCGCSSPQQQIKEAYIANWKDAGRRLAMLYTQCMAEAAGPMRGPNDFIGPTDEAALRRFIAAIPSETLKLMGIESADSPVLFVSPRDRQPFRVRYGIKGPLTTRYAVVCESKGVNGKVKVYRGDGSSLEVPEAEADAYMAGKHDVVYDPRAPAS